MMVCAEERIKYKDDANEKDQSTSTSKNLAAIEPQARKALIYPFDIKYH